uniref:Direct IAP-binding protein with low pI n=1 Tax=Seriola dumerili TaxID=41447 RepID=A0A3B4U8B1_SERDU
MIMSLFSPGEGTSVQSLQSLYSSGTFVRPQRDGHFMVADQHGHTQERGSLPQLSQVDTLSHDSLIRRAASLVTDSSSTFLSQTTLALIDAITEYSKAVHTLIALQRRYLTSLGKLSPAEEDSIWQVILGQRAEVNDRHDECKRFESTWVSAVKMCETAAEAAYTSGAEHASITVRTNVQVALSQVEEAQKLSADADKKLAETKVMEIERVAKYAAAQNNHDEEEVPEAYLRED